MEEFVVYVLYSFKFQKIYVGMSSDLINRYHSHNTFAKKGYTVRFRPWIVVHVEACDNKKGALIREAQLKSARGRKFIYEEIISKY